MINKDSIVTAYDEHLTLVEWLQKVEKALDNAVLTNLGIAKLSEQNNVATYQVTATFADNTTIVSNAFTLPSTDIVTAFSNLTTLVNGFDTRITGNTNNVASIIDIIDIGNNKIKAATLQNSINGSDEVIVDIDATNDKLEIHLSAELQAKLARVLLKPSSAPTTRKVVTIDTNGAQDNVDGTELTTLLENIVDSDGHKRFFTNDLGTSYYGSFTSLYSKLALSGNHLMIVLGFKLTGSLGVSSKIFFDIPSWIKDLLVVIKGDNIVNVTTAKLNLTGDEMKYFVLKKARDTLMEVEYQKEAGSTQGSADDVLRVQFDLIIDN